MKKADYPEPFLALVRELRRLPGVGPRSAERLVLWLEDGERPRLCRGHYGGPDECATARRQVSAWSSGAICADEAREPQLCIVERPRFSVERSIFMNAPCAWRTCALEHVGPEDLRLGELTARLERGNFTEIILALSTDVEGEATANYLVELLLPRGVHVSRLAQGMPAGGGLESADELTLARALSGRRQAGAV